MAHPTVWFAPLTEGASPEAQAEAARRLIEKAGAGAVVAENDFVAVKVHVGEKGNTTHMKPEVVKAVVDAVKEKGGQPFLTETSTLYKGERMNAVKHLMHAHLHGFGIEAMGAPFIPMDGLMGNSETEVAIDGALHKSVKLGIEMAAVDALFSVAHVTGHMVTGIGATLKTLGMGLSSRQGKLRQHSTVKLLVDPESCRLCRKCMRWCPQSAIVEQEKKAFIIADRCVGCGECLAVCRYTAIGFEWNADSKTLQESMAEHAYGAVVRIRSKCFFLNVMMDMTSECDCLGTEQAAAFGMEQKKVLPDMGLLASYDPVAIDKAALDLTAKAKGKSIAELAHAHQDPLHQMRHAAEIGLGSLEYELVTL